MPLAAFGPQTTTRRLSFFSFLFFPFFFFFKVEIAAQMQRVVTLGLGTTLKVQEAWLRSFCGDGEFGSGQSDMEVIPVLRSQCYIN